MAVHEEWWFTRDGGTDGIRSKLTRCSSDQSSMAPAIERHLREEMFGADGGVMRPAPRDTHTGASGEEQEEEHPDAPL